MSEKPEKRTRESIAATTPSFTLEPCKFKWGFDDDDDSDNDSERDEEKSITLPKCEPSESSQISEFKWPIIGPDGVRCGHVNGHLIKRDELRGRGALLREMDVVSQELMDIAQSLFTPLATLQPSLRAAVWGTSLDRGSIVYLDEIELAPLHRKKGALAVLLPQLFHHTKASCVLAVPALLGSEYASYPPPYKFTNKFPEDKWPKEPTKKEKLEFKKAQIEQEGQINKLTASLRHVGCRRIGSTPYVAVVPDKSHPCYDVAGIDAAEKVDEPGWQPPRVISRSDVMGSLGVNMEGEFAESVEAEMCRNYGLPPPKVSAALPKPIADALDTAGLGEFLMKMAHAHVDDITPDLKRMCPKGAWDKMGADMKEAMKRLGEKDWQYFLTPKKNFQVDNAQAVLAGSKKVWEKTKFKGQCQALWDFLLAQLPK